MKKRLQIARPFKGQTVREADTDETYVYDGTGWVLITGAVELVTAALETDNEWADWTGYGHQHVAVIAIKTLRDAGYKV